MTSNTLELLSPDQELARRRLPLGPGVVVGSLGTTLAGCPLVRLGVQARCSGPVAAVQVAQAFMNPNQEPLELTYLFPLPPGAVVSRFRASVGGRVLEGQVFEKEQAKKQFAKPSRSPYLAMIFEREYHPVFSVPLGLVNPGENIQIELAYAELVPAHNGDFQLRFPFLISPRMLPGASIEGPNGTDTVVMTPGLALGPNLIVTVALEGGNILPMRMATTQPCQVHKLPTGDVGLELMKQGDMQPRDFIFAYRYGTERTPQSQLRHTQSHFVLTVSPPAAKPPATWPRDLVILADISDNTSAERMPALQTLVSHLLQSLGPGERFALVGFNDNLTGYMEGNLCATEDAPQALKWFQGMKARGRANTHVLLQRVIGMVPEPSRALTVVVLACGHVGNEPELYSKMFETLNGGAPPFRFFTVGVDFNISVPFLRRLASWTRGRFFQASSDEDIDQLGMSLVEETRYPLIGDLQLVDQGLGPLYDTIYPGAIPGVGGMQPVTVLGLKNGAGALEVRGRAFSGAAWGEVSQPLPSQNPALGLVWAHQKIREMQDEAKLISGPRSTDMRRVIMDQSQKYRLLNDFTAFAVIDPQSAGSPSGPGGTLVPSLLPHEWRDEMSADLPPLGGGGRDRVRISNVKLVEPVAAEESGAQSGELVGEPPKARPGLKDGLVSADDMGEAAPGLKHKPPLKSGLKHGGSKRELKQPMPSGPKIQATANKGPMTLKDGKAPSGKSTLKKPPLPRPGTDDKPQGALEPSAEPVSAAPVSHAAAAGEAKKTLPKDPVLMGAQKKTATAAQDEAEGFHEGEHAEQVQAEVEPHPEPATESYDNVPTGGISHGPNNNVAGGHVAAPPPVQPPAPPAPPPAGVPAAQVGGAAPAAAPAPAGAAAATATAPAPSGEGPPNHEQIARELLKTNQEMRTALMADMRSLYQAIAKGAGAEAHVLGFLERILRRIQPVIEQSAMLKEVYRVGVLCYKAIQAKDPQGMAKTQHWIQKFATLF